MVRNVEEGICLFHPKCIEGPLENTFSFSRVFAKRKSEYITTIFEPHTNHFKMIQDKFQSNLTFLKNKNKHTQRRWAEEGDYHLPEQPSEKLLPESA